MPGNYLQIEFLCALRVSSMLSVSLSSLLKYVEVKS
jgi:hypothetical protein